MRTSAVRDCDALSGISLPQPSRLRLSFCGFCPSSTAQKICARLPPPPKERLDKIPKSHDPNRETDVRGLQFGSGPSQSHPREVGVYARRRLPPKRYLRIRFVVALRRHQALCKTEVVDVAGCRGTLRFGASPDPAVRFGTNGDGESRDRLGVTLIRVSDWITRSLLPFQTGG